MKKQPSTTKTIIQAALLLIATVLTFTARAQGTTALGDFNNDGLGDVAAITSSTTATVYLANADGSSNVSAVLSTPRNKTITYLYVYDHDGDGVLDVIASGPASGGWITAYIWPGNGDGTFRSVVTSRFRWKNNNWI